MNRRLRVVFGVLACLSCVASWAGGNCGGPMGATIVVGQCVNACVRNRDLNGSAPSSNACARFCRCSCEMDKGALQAQAGTVLTPDELADPTLSDRVCEARTWPQNYSMPTQFIPHYTGPEESIVRMFAMRTWPPLYGSNRSAVTAMLTADNKEGPELLQCVFTAGNGGHVAFHFWPGKRPANLDALLRADTEGQLRLIDRTALAHCPRSYEEASKLRETIIAGSGHPER